MEDLYGVPKRKPSSSVASSSSSLNQLSLNIINSVVFEPRAKYTVYKINVCNEDERRWLVYRRYSDFVLLNKKLQRLFAAITLNLPPKRWFLNNFNATFIRKRQDGLQNFLTTIFTLEELYKSEPVQKFFRLDKPPDPSEDLAACKHYCDKLVDECNSLKGHLNQQGQEITRLTEEIAEWESLHDKNEQDKTAVATVLLLEKEEMGKQIAELSTNITQRDNEIRHMQEEYRQSEAYANAVRMRERQSRDTQIKDHEKTFREKQKNVDAAYNSIANSLSELGNVKIGFGGQSIDLNTVDSLSIKERELRRVLEESRKEMESLYNENMEFYRKELENAKVDVAKRERELKNTLSDLSLVQQNLQEVTHRHEQEKNTADILIQQYQAQLATHARYATRLEQRYFYSLVLGVKLNMALYGQLDELMDNNLEAHELYLKVRDVTTNIEEWPKWIALHVKNNSR